MSTLTDDIGAFVALRDKLKAHQEGLRALQAQRPLAPEEAQQAELLTGVLGGGAVPAASREVPILEAPRPRVPVRLADAALASEVVTALKQAGFDATAGLETEGQVAMVVADRTWALDALARNPGAPVVLVGASGPDALVGRLALLEPAAFVPRPTAAAVVEAVQQASGLGGPAAR